MAISLDKVGLTCYKTLVVKTTGNNSNYITYSNTLYFSGLFLDKHVYILHVWGEIVGKYSNN